MNTSEGNIWRIYNESLNLNDIEFDLFIDELHNSNVPSAALDECIKNAKEKRRKIADILNRF
jgi:hypothetical protein